MNLISKFQSAYSSIDSYLDKAIEKSDATYNMENIRAGNVGSMETICANICGFSGMYAGEALPMITTGLAIYGLLRSLGAEEKLATIGMIGGVLANNNKLCNLSRKVGAVAGSKTGAVIGKTIDFIFYKDLFKNKV